ncbi:UNVERIFIED_CONTAM: hypothetical protein HHA_268035 [Hammondia hammondi]|eukprot:XP_008882216.1 hypothetical protein HHA_268035 [Hammondia hammondi]
MRFAGEDSACAVPSRLSSAEVSLSKLQRSSSRCLLLGARSGTREADVKPRGTEAKRTCFKRGEPESEETETEERGETEREERTEIVKEERGEIEKEERTEIQKEEREETEGEENGAPEREESQETERDKREETENEKSEGSETRETDLLSSQDEASADARRSETDRKRVEGHKQERERDATEKPPEDEPRVVAQAPPHGERCSPLGTERLSEAALSKHGETDDDKVSPEEGEGVQERQTATRQAHKERKEHSAVKGATAPKESDGREVEAKEAEKAKKPQSRGDERASAERGSPNVEQRQWLTSEAGEREAQWRQEIEKVAESGRSAACLPDAELPRAAASAVTKRGEKDERNGSDRGENSIQEEDGETPKTQEQSPQVGSRKEVAAQEDSGSKSEESREAERGERETDGTLQDAEREAADILTEPQRSRRETSPENAAEETAGGAEQDSTGDRQCGTPALHCPKNTSESGNGEDTGGTTATRRTSGETGSEARGDLPSGCDRNKILPLDGEAEETPAVAQQVTPVCGPMQKGDVEERSPHIPRQSREPLPPSSPFSPSSSLPGLDVALPPSPHSPPLSQSPHPIASSGDAASSSSPERLLRDKQETLHRGGKPQEPRVEMLDDGERGEERRQLPLTEGRETLAGEPRGEAISVGQRTDSEEEKGAQVAEAPQRENGESRSRGKAADAAKETVQEEQRGLACVGRQAFNPRSSSPDEAQRKQEEEPNNQKATEEKQEEDEKNSEASAVLEEEAKDARSGGSDERKAAREEDRENEGDERCGEAQRGDVCEAPREKEEQISGAEQETHFACSSAGACLDTETADATAARDGETRDTAEELETAMELEDRIAKSKKEEGRGEEGTETVMPAPAASELLCAGSAGDWNVEPRPTGRSVASFSSPSGVPAMSSMESVAASLAPSLPSSSAFASASSSSPSVASAFTFSQPRRDTCLSLCASGGVGGVEARGRPETRARGGTGDPHAEVTEEEARASEKEQEERRTVARGEGQCRDSVEAADAGRARRSPARRVFDACHDGEEDCGPQGEEVDSGDRMNEPVAEAEGDIKPESELLCPIDSDHEARLVSGGEKSRIPSHQVWRSSTKSSRPKSSKSFSSPGRLSRRLGPRLRRPSFARVPRALRSERRGRGEGSSRRGEGPVNRAGSRVHGEDRRDEGKLTGDEQRRGDSPVTTREEDRGTESGRVADAPHAEEASRAGAGKETRGCEQQLRAETRQLAENEGAVRREGDEGSVGGTDGDRREAEAETGRKRRQAGPEPAEVSEAPRGVDRQREREGSRSGETPDRAADSKREAVVDATQHTGCASGLGEDRGKEGSALHAHPDGQVRRHKELKRAASRARHPGRESRREARETHGKQIREKAVAADETATQTAQLVAGPRAVAPVKVAEQLEAKTREKGKRRAGKDETSTREQEWHRDRNSQRREACETKEAGHLSCASSRSLAAVGDSSGKDLRLPGEALEQGEKHPPPHEKEKHVKQHVEELRERVRQLAAVTSGDEDAQPLGKETGTGAERCETPKNNVSSGTSASLTSSDQRATPEPQVPPSSFSLASFLAFATWLARPKKSEDVRSPAPAALDEQPAAEQSGAREKREEQSGNGDSEAIEAFLSASLHAEAKPGVVQRRHPRRMVETRDGIVPLGRRAQSRSNSEERPSSALQVRGDNMESLAKKAVRHASREKKQEERGRNKIVEAPFIDLPPLFSPPSFFLASLSCDSLAHPSSAGGRPSHAVPRSPPWLVREAPSSSPPSPSRLRVLDRALVSSSSASSGCSSANSANSVSQVSNSAASSVSALAAAEPPSASGLSDLLALWIEEGEKLRREEAKSLDQSAFDHSPARAQTQADFLEACSRRGPHQPLRPVSLAPAAAGRRRRSVACSPPVSSFCPQRSWTLPPSSSSLLRPVEPDTLSAFLQQVEDPRSFPSPPSPRPSPHGCGPVSVSSFPPSHANALEVSSPFPFFAASAPVSESNPRVVSCGMQSTSPHVDSQLRGAAAPRLLRVCFPPDRLGENVLRRGAVCGAARDLAARDEERRKIVQMIAVYSVQSRRPDRTGTSDGLCVPQSVYQGPENAPCSPPLPSQTVSPTLLNVAHASSLSPLLPTCSEAFFPLPFSPSPAPASPLLLPHLSESLEAPGVVQSVFCPLAECPSVQASPPSPFARAAVETPLLFGASRVSSTSLDAQRNAEGNVPRVAGPRDAAFPLDALEVEAAFLSGVASGGEAKNLGSTIYVKRWKGKPRVHNAEARYVDEERLGGGTGGRQLRVVKASSEREKRRIKTKRTSAVVQTEETGDDEPSDVGLVFGSLVNSSRASSFSDPAARRRASPVPPEGAGEPERGAVEQRKTEAGTEEKGREMDAYIQEHDGSSLRGGPREGKGGRDEKVKRVQHSRDVPSSAPLFSRVPASESLSRLLRRSQASLPASILASSLHPTASFHASRNAQGKASAPSPVLPAAESSGRALPSSLASSLSFPLSSLSSALSSPLPSFFSSSVSSSASEPPRVSVGVNAVSHREVQLRRRMEEKKNCVSRQWVLASSPQEQSWRAEATKGEGERRRGERESEKGGRRGSTKPPISPSECTSFSSPSLFSGSASAFPSSASLGEKRGAEKRKTHRDRREKGEVREEGISVFGRTPEEIIQRQQKELQEKRERQEKRGRQEAREKQDKRERKQTPQTAAAGASASGGCFEALKPHGGNRPEGIPASSTSSLSASHHSEPGGFFSVYSRLALEKEDEEYLFSLPVLDDAVGSSSRVVQRKGETGGDRCRRFEVAVDGQQESCRSSSCRTGATAEALHAASASEEALKRWLGVLRAQGEEQRLRLDRLERQKSLLEKFEEERIERQAVLASLQEERRRGEEDALAAERQAREQRVEKEKHSREPTRGRPAKDRQPSRTRRLSANAIEVVAWLATETEEKVRSVSRRAASRVRKLRRGRDSKRCASASQPEKRCPNAQNGNRGRISFQDPHLPDVHPTSDSALPARLPPHGILLTSRQPGSQFDWTRRTSMAERGQAHASRGNEVTFSYVEQRAVTASIEQSNDPKVVRQEELADTASIEVYVHRSEAIESQHGHEETERGRAKRSAYAGRRGSGRVLRAGESGQNEDGEAASKQRRKRELLRQAATVARLTVATATVTVASAGASAVQSMREKLRKRREKTEKEDFTL